MGNYVFRLRWTRCTDGAEFVQHERKKGGVIRYRSSQRETYRRRLEDVSDPIVVEFLNTEPDDRGVGLPELLSFIDQYGFLHGHGEQADVSELLSDRAKFREILTAYTERDIIEAATQFDAASGRMTEDLAALTDDERPDAFRDMDRRASISGIKPDIHFHNNRPVLMLPIETLYGFMLMETGLIITGGAQVLRCEHCGAIFVTGAGTGRRNTARYCANRCRVAAQRAK